MAALHLAPRAGDVEIPGLVVCGDRGRSGSSGGVGGLPALTNAPRGAMPALTDAPTVPPHAPAAGLPALPPPSVAADPPPATAAGHAGMLQLGAAASASDSKQSLSTTQAAQRLADALKARKDAENDDFGEPADGGADGAAAPKPKPKSKGKGKGKGKGKDPKPAPKAPKPAAPATKSKSTEAPKAPATKSKSTVAPKAKAKAKAAIKSITKVKAVKTEIRSRVTFPGLPTEPTAPIFVGEYKVYTDMTQKAWRALMPGGGQYDRNDKKFKFTEDEASARQVWKKLREYCNA
eukprot:9498426-Pyramimonas_sp.AAC.1